MIPDKTVVMESLRDIRELLPHSEGVQNAYLQNQLPPLYRPGTLDIPAGDKIESSGLEVLLVVIRRLLSHLRDQYRNAKLDDAIREQEQENPILRLAMADYSSTDKKTIYAAMCHSLKAFYPDGELGALESKQLSFESLAEHQLMRTTLWMRNTFLLHNAKTLRKHQGEAVTLVNIAPKSLVAWSLSRFQTGDLGDTLSSYHGWKEKGTIAIHHGNPRIIRVHYTVDPTDPKTFHDLRRVTFNPTRLLVELSATGDVERWKWSEPDSNKTTYTLLAAVRLTADPSNPKLRDTVRTYTREGHMIPVQAPGFPLMRADEPLGQPGAVYYLYYGIGPQVIPLEPVPIELRFMPDMSIGAKIEKAVQGDEKPRSQRGVGGVGGVEGGDRGQASRQGDRTDRAEPSLRADQPSLQSRSDRGVRPSPRDDRIDRTSRPRDRERSPEARRSKYFPPQPREEDRHDSNRGSYRDRGYGPLPEYDEGRSDRRPNRRPDRPDHRDSHRGRGQDRGRGRSYDSGGRGRQSGSVTWSGLAGRGSSQGASHGSSQGAGRGSNQGAGRGFGPAPGTGLSSERQVLPLYPTTSAPAAPPRLIIRSDRSEAPRRVANRNPGRTQDGKDKSRK